MKAGNFIELNQPFEVKEGAIFHAFIEMCEEVSVVNCCEDICYRTDFPDPYADISNYVTRSAVVPQVLIRTALFTNPSRSTSLTTSNHVAGVAYHDPLVHPGVVGGPVGAANPAIPHEHEWLGNVFGPSANMLDLPNEPLNWQPGTDAANEGFGYRGLITDDNGNRFGYSPGIWWPRIYFDGKPVSIKRGIAVYYVRRRSHDGERVFLLPNGVGYVITDQLRFSLQEGTNGVDWRIAVFGPNWFHKDIHVGPFPIPDGSYNDQYLSYDTTKPAGEGWCAAAEFQTYLKMDIPDGAPTYAQMLAEGGLASPRFHFGNPTDVGIPFHIDYVAGWTNQDFVQELLDRCCNRDISGPSLNIKFEGWRPEWNTTAAATPAPPDLGPCSVQ